MHIGIRTHGVEDKMEKYRSLCSNYLNRGVFAYLKHSSVISSMLDALEDDTLLSPTHQELQQIRSSHARGELVLWLVVSLRIAPALTIETPPLAA